MTMLYIPPPIQPALHPIPCTLAPEITSAVSIVGITQVICTQMAHSAKLLVYFVSHRSIIKSFYSTVFGDAVLFK
jgi:hypothetical protein